MKTYIAGSVWLHHVPQQHVSSNGSRQFTILCRAKSQRRVAELVGCSVSQLRGFCGIHLAPEFIGFDSGRRLVSDIVTKDDTVFYEQGFGRGEWHEYTP